MSAPIRHGCNEPENPTGIETKFDLPGISTAGIVATNQKTRQGLKPGSRALRELSPMKLQRTRKPDRD